MHQMSNDYSSYWEVELYPLHLHCSSFVTVPILDPVLQNSAALNL
ncbi:hypothetical protein PROFUN_12311 [Planoprotostelium fungivorum]|uniref:Uncharacterized protein n=1 Tax=Planoprotostelium fungivorum TaxID=1890364 RepID=A0A2P6N7U5_9EUKA|nr:hypothetical protein PROFUN_12311 [Planoprotostelium fungivorum]